MLKFVLAPAFAGLLTLSATGEAQAFSRHGTVYGPYGSATVHASGSCAAGTCSRSVTRKGAYGATMSRSGTASCAGGYCTGSSTTIGPRGNVVTRSGSFHRY